MQNTTALRSDMAKQGWHIHRVSDVKPTCFQVLGERGSGTNLVRKSITKTFRMMRTEALGWKHGMPHMIAIPQDMLVVISVRNAFDWAASLYKRPWHGDPVMQTLSFSDFLRAEWAGIVDRTSDFEGVHPELHVDQQPLQLDRHPITGKAYENIFEMRNVKAEGMIGMMNRGCNLAFVQMEKFIDNPLGFLEAVDKHFALAGTERGYRPITRKMGNRFRPTVKNRPAPPAPWPANDRDFALSQLDPEIEAALGYSY